MKRAYVKLRPLWSLIIVGLVGYLFAETLLSNWENISHLTIAPTWQSVVGMSLLILSVVTSGIAWGKIVYRLSGERIAYAEFVRVHIGSWLLKYIPGQAGSYLNKLSWGVKRGLSKKLITSSFIYETVMLTLASVLPTAPIILWLLSRNVSPNLSIFLPLLAILPMLAVLHRDTFYKLANWFAKKLDKKPFNEDLFLSTKDLWLTLLSYVVPRIFNGLGFVFIASSLFSVSLGMFVPLAASYVLAGIVGVLAIFVPSGLGIREAVLALLLSVYFSPEESVALALIARFYATISDAGLAVLYVVMKKGVST